MRDTVVTSRNVTSIVRRSALLVALFRSPVSLYLHLISTTPRLFPTRISGDLPSLWEAFLRFDAQAMMVLYCHSGSQSPPPAVHGTGRGLGNFAA